VTSRVLPSYARRASEPTDAEKAHLSRGLQNPSTHDNSKRREQGLFEKILIEEESILPVGLQSKEFTDCEKMPSSDGLDWSKSIRSVLKSSDVMDVKSLRKSVLLSLQLDESDKAVKKQFKRTVQQLEEEQVLRLDVDGTIKLVKEKKKRQRDTKDEKKSKKKKQKNTADVEDKEEEEVAVHEKSRGDDDDEEEAEEEDVDDKAGETTKPIEGNVANSSGSKNKPVKGNPQGVTRLFIGNLPFTVDEASLGAFLPGEVTHIKWITDKETGKFYGSAFVEMDHSISAAKAVAMAGEKLIGRPIKINFAPARDDDVWPPVKKVVSGGGSTKSRGTAGGGQAGGKGIKAMSAKPDGCVKLFIGNLSYDIDDEGITKFFGNVDAEVKAVRWLHHRDSGDFKGV